MDIFLFHRWNNTGKIMEKSTLSPTLEIETGYFMKSITVKKCLSKPQKQRDDN